MSGTWTERAAAGAALKPADLGNALKDLAGALADLGEGVATSRRLDDLEATVAALTARLAEVDAPKPAKATRSAEGKSAQ